MGSTAIISRKPAHRFRHRINLIYTDTRYAFEENFETISTYADKLQGAMNMALDEETVLIAVLRVYHAQK